jgi:hypothetical protein
VEPQIMRKFQLRHRWTSAGNDTPELRQTICRLELQIGETSLTLNEDIFSQTISNSVLVSAYPLACWFAASWWRLVSEPLPPRAIRPPTSWRMAHEIGAANSGYVWPQVLFATDGEAMQVWAIPSRDSRDQSVRYLNGLAAPVTFPMDDFEIEIESFINAVIARLDATGLTGAETTLGALWAEVMEERADPTTALARRCEAELGYEPDECPEEILLTAIRLKDRIGEAALSELAPVYGKASGKDSIADLGKLIECRGISGRPDLPRISSKIGKGVAPWERAVADARQLRNELGVCGDHIDTSLLCEALGVQRDEIDHYATGSHNRVAIVVPRGNRHVSLIPRKRHPRSKRFELARFIGDLLYVHSNTDAWLASTDLSTNRQKYQRAFAAEFLCPIDNLQDFLDDDFSDDNLEDAADHFEISPATVTSLLANNNLLYKEFGASGLPYVLS